MYEKSGKNKWQNILIINDIRKPISIRVIMTSFKEWDVRKESLFNQNQNQKKCYVPLKSRQNKKKLEQYTKKKVYKEL